MGSCLAPTFTDFYMCDLENKVLSNIDIKPSMFCRYFDDIYVVIRNEEHLQHLKHQFEENSVLNFTHEMNANKLSFLDIDIEIIYNQYNLSVFRKATDSGKSINPKSECPDRYMSSAIRSYIHRAYKTCTFEGNLNVELSRVKKILINNGFSNLQVDEVIQKYSSNRTTLQE